MTVKHDLLQKELSNIIKIQNISKHFLLQSHFLRTLAKTFLTPSLCSDLGQSRLCKITKKRRFGSPTVLRLRLHSPQLNHHFRPHFLLHESKKMLKDLWKIIKPRPWIAILSQWRGFCAPVTLRAVVWGALSAWSTERPRQRNLLALDLRMGQR